MVYSLLATACALLLFFSLPEPPPAPEKRLDPPVATPPVQTRPPTPPPLNQQHVREPLVDRILVEKGARRLSLLRHGKSVRSYRIALGPNPLHPKIQEGDGRTPEGEFTIDYRNPQSRFHRSLHISYPRPEDQLRAEAMEVSPGGDIMIHGLGPQRRWAGTEHFQQDWTEGCIAVTDEEIDEIWEMVDDGTHIEIRP